MIDSKVALRYAKAVLDLAVSSKATDNVEGDMRAILETISGSSELQEFLMNPIIGGNVKKEALKSVFKNIHSVTEGLFTLLVDNKRIALLNEVALKYIALNEALKGQDVAFVTTAVALTPDLEQKIIKHVSQLTSNKVSLKSNIDESIIGGFVLRIGDLQYDASIASKLSNLKRAFTKSL